VKLMGFRSIRRDKNKAIEYFKKAEEKGSV
jgi:hypothetical protein